MLIKLSFLLIILVISTQFFLIKPIIGQGFTHEDYVGLLPARILKDKFFKDPIGTWQQIGLHDASHVFYIHFLDILFGENYNMYLYFSAFLKILATLSLFPLILIVTKNKLLAFLGTFLYSISYSSFGALYLYVLGNEYLSLLFLNIFLIIYYICIRKTKIWLVLLSSIFIILSYLSSPIRIFPLFAIIILTELFFLIRSKFSNLLPFLLRVVLVYLPIILIVFSSTGKSSGDGYGLSSIPVFLKIIEKGHWYLLLNPLWGLGHSLIPSSYFHFFGQVNISNFLSYIFSTFHFLILIIAFILSFLLSAKPIRFFLIFVFINSMLEIIIYTLLIHHLGISHELILEYNPEVFILGQYAGILAAFVLSFSIAAFVQWHLDSKANRLLLFIFFAPFISLIFIGGQWLFTQQYFMYQEGIHRYLVIPQVGMSIFLASILTSSYRKNQSWWYVFLTVIIFLNFFISKGEIERVFYIKRNAGANLQTQELMKSQVLSSIPNKNLKNDLLFFVKLSAGPKYSTPLEDSLDWRNLIYWMHTKRSYLTEQGMNGCVAIIWEVNELQRIAVLQNGEKGFLFSDGANGEASCLNNGLGVSTDKRFYKISDFYAFIIDTMGLRNITYEIIKKLIFIPNQ